MSDRLLAVLLRPTAPPLIWGVVTAAVLIVVEIVIVQQLKRVSPDNAFGAFFLLGVLVVSAGWGFGLAVATSLVSTVAYVYFHTGDDRGSTVPAVLVFLTLALLTNLLVEQARLRADEANQRRLAANLATELARLMLQAPDMAAGLVAVGRRMADALELPFAVLTTGEPANEAGHDTIALRDGNAHVGFLVLPADLGRRHEQRVRRMRGSLGSLLATARQREDITAALEVSRRELERFFAVTSELLCIGDADGFHRINPSFEHVLGYTADDVRQTPFLSLVDPDDRPAVEPMVKRALRTGGTVGFEVRCLCRDGSPRWLEWSVVSDQGVFFAAARDTTERRQEQQRLVQTQRELRESHAVATTLAREQAALRRVATLVARRADPAELYPRVVSELANVLDVEHVTLVRFGPPATAVALATHDARQGATPPPGEELLSDDEPVDADRAAARLRQSARLGSTTGVPIDVDGRLWGALLVGSERVDPMPPETAKRVGDFADLVATAVYNAETRAELTASRARIVAAADQARRRFERDLHDGAQQRIVSLGLEVGLIEASLPPEDQALRAKLTQVVDDLSSLYADIQELSRGIHPAILSRGGLGPAISVLARRCPLPVVLDVDVTHRLPESVEVAAYYVVAEALTNAAKHARASEATVRALLADGQLRLAVTDNGAGGASSAAGGSGLTGLKDRVEALGGRLVITSPPGVGTTVAAVIPAPPG